MTTLRRHHRRMEKTQSRAQLRSVKSGRLTIAGATAGAASPDGRAVPMSTSPASQSNIIFGSSLTENSGLLFSASRFDTSQRSDEELGTEMAEVEDDANVSISLDEIDNDEIMTPEGDGVLLGVNLLAKDQSTRFRRVATRVRDFFAHLLDDAGAERQDYYLGLFFVEFVAFLVVIIGWPAFSQANASDNVSSPANFIKQNNIPPLFLAYVLLQFVLIVFDRIVYLHRMFRVKLALHYFLLLGVHLLVFYALPVTTSRPFHTNHTVIVWYLLKVVYFALSAAQLRSLYPERVLQNYLTTSGTTTLRYILYKVYVAFFACFCTFVNHL
jgi:hypothetical protein